MSTNESPGVHGTMHHGEEAGTQPRTLATTEDALAAQRENANPFHNGGTLARTYQRLLGNRFAVAAIAPWLKPP